VASLLLDNLGTYASTKQASEKEREYRSECSKPPALLSSPSGLILSSAIITVENCQGMRCGSAASLGRKCVEVGWSSNSCCREDGWLVVQRIVLVRDAESISYCAYGMSKQAIEGEDKCEGGVVSRAETRPRGFDMKQHFKAFSCSIQKARPSATHLTRKRSGSSVDVFFITAVG